MLCLIFNLFRWLYGSLFHYCFNHTFSIGWWQAVGEVVLKTIEMHNDAAHKKTTEKRALIKIFIKFKIANRPIFLSSHLATKHD